ncbi:MAG: glutaminyl-peptide cyclotransferase [Candidatus Microthrix sp.]|nr:glutaminyl-peptide cyclotransferase [Candidatus Microthrix sp.]
MTGAPVSELDELECVDGGVWANVWQSDTIVVIDPVDGAQLDATVDASGLLTEDQRAEADAAQRHPSAARTGHSSSHRQAWPGGVPVVNFEAYRGDR